MDALIALLAPFGPSERSAQVYLRQGDAYTLLERFEAADRALAQLECAPAVLEAALKRTEVSDHPARYGALLNVMGTIHRELGNLDTALEFFRRTEAYLTVTVYASFSLTSIVHIQLQQGRVEEALESYRDVLRLNRLASFVEGIALGCRSLGEVLVGLERHEESVAYPHESATRFAQIEDHRSEALMWRRLAGVHEHRGAPEQARAAWMKARELHQKHTSRSYEAETSLNKLRRWDEALTTLTDAVRVKTASGEQALLGHALSALADVCIGRGRFHESLEYLQSAMTIRLAMGDRRGEGWLLERKARVHRALGNHAEAASATQSAERIAHELADVALRDAVTAIT